MLIDGRDIDSLRVVDLRVELEKRGLTKSGTKKDLVARLRKFLTETQVVVEQVPVAAVPETSPPGDKALPNVGICLLYTSPSPRD